MEVLPRQPYTMAEEAPGAWNANPKDREHREVLLALAEQNGRPEPEVIVRLHPLNSRRITREVYQTMARQMNLPTRGTRDEALQMVEGRQGY